MQRNKGDKTMIGSFFKGIFGAVTGFFGGGGLWAYAAVAAVTAATVGFGAYKVADWRIDSNKLGFQQIIAKRDAQDAVDKLEASRALLRASERAMAKTLELQRTTDEAINRANQKTIIAARDAAAARAESDGLRDTIATRAADLSRASRASILGYADALGELLNTCSREREEFAGKADFHAIDALKLWEAWPVLGVAPAPSR